MCDRVITDDPFMLVYCLNKYETQRTCDKAVDDCLAEWKFIPDEFVTCKLLKKFDNSLCAYSDIFYYNEDFDKITFIATHRHILAVNLDKINLDNDNSFDEDDPDTVIHGGLLTWHSKF